MEHCKMKKLSRDPLYTAITGILALTIAGAGSLYAQEPGAEEVQMDSGLEEVIVTARKREESVQDVPLNVAALTEQQIRERDLTSLEKLAAVTPNFSVGRASNGSGAQLTLRGIGSNSTSIGIEQSVAVIVDGAYYGQGRVINEGFFDMERVEVLKGPQALFFGKNATAGVISFTTADPGEEREFIVRGLYEFEGETALAEGIASVPLSDTFGFRLAVRGSKMDGGLWKNEMYPFDYPTFDIATGVTTLHQPPPAQSPAPGEEETLARLTLKWTPNDLWTANLKIMLDRNEINNSSWNYSCFASPTGVSALNGYPCDGDFVSHQADFPLAIAADFPAARSDGQLYNDYESEALTFTLVRDSDNYNFTWVTNWNSNDNSWACNCDFQANPLTVFATEDASWEALSSELRMLTTYDGPFNGMIGAYYQDTNRDFDQWIAFGNVEDSSQSARNRYIATSKDSETDGKTWSLFGEFIWEVSDAMEVTLGGRYIKETKDSYFLQPYNNAALTAIFRPAEDPLGVVTADQKFTDFLPEATFTWRFADDAMAYVAYKTGYKSGGFSNSGINSGLSLTPADDLTFDEERAEGFEAGLKSTLVDNQLRLNATVYSYDYEDLQVDFFRSDIFAFNTVTADAQVQGFELEAAYAPNALSGLNLYGVLNYNKSEYKDSIMPCYQGQTPAAGCTIDNNGVPYQDVDGASTAVAPEWAAAFGARYELPIGDSMYLAFAGDTRYSDDYIASGFNNPLSKIDSYWYWDASIRLGATSGRWEVALIGKNLSDEFYVSGVVDGPSTGSGAGTPEGVLADQMGFGNIPRTIAAEVTWRF